MDLPLATGGDLSGPRSRRALKQRATSDLWATLGGAAITIACLFFFVLAVLQASEGLGGSSGLLIAFQAMHLVIFFFIGVTGILLLTKILRAIFEANSVSARRPAWDAAIAAALLLITAGFDVVGNVLQLFFPIASVTKLSLAEDCWTIAETIVVGAVLALLELAPSTSKQFRRWKLVFLPAVAGISLAFYYVNLGTGQDSWADTTLQNTAIARLSKTLATAFRAGCSLLAVDHLLKTVTDLLINPNRHVPQSQLDGPLLPGQFRKVKGNKSGSAGSSSASRSASSAAFLRRRPRAASESSDASSISSAEMVSPHQSDDRRRRSSGNNSGVGKEWAGAAAAIAGDGGTDNFSSRQISVDTTVATPVAATAAVSGPVGALAEKVAADPLVVASKALEALNSNIAARAALFGRRPFASVLTSAFGTVVTVILLASLLADPLPSGLQNVAFSLVLLLSFSTLGSLMALIALSMRKGWMEPLLVPYEIWTKDVPVASGFLRCFIPSIGAAGWHLLFIVATQNKYQAVVGGVALAVSIVQGAVSAYLLANSPLTIVLHEVDTGFGTISAAPPGYTAASARGVSSGPTVSGTQPSAGILLIKAATSRLPISSVMTVDSLRSPVNESGAGQTKAGASNVRLSSRSASSASTSNGGSATVPLLSEEGNGFSGGAAAGDVRYAAASEGIAGLPSASQPTASQWARQERIELVLQFFLAVNIIFNLSQLLLVLWPTQQSVWTSNSLFTSLEAASKSLAAFFYAFCVGTAFSGRSSFQVLLPAEAEARNAALRVLYTRELPEGLGILRALAAQLEHHKVGGWRWRDKLVSDNGNSSETGGVAGTTLLEATKRIIMTAMAGAADERGPAVNGAIGSPAAAGDTTSAPSVHVSSPRGSIAPSNPASAARAHSLSTIRFDSNAGSAPSSQRALSSHRPSIPLLAPPGITTLPATSSSARGFDTNGSSASAQLASYGSTGVTQSALPTNAAPSAQYQMGDVSRALSRNTPTQSLGADDPFYLIGGRESFASVTTAVHHQQVPMIATAASARDALGLSGDAQHHRGSIVDVDI